MALPLVVRYRSINSASSAARLGASTSATTSALRALISPASRDAASSVLPTSPSRLNCALNWAGSASGVNQSFFHSPFTVAMESQHRNSCPSYSLADSDWRG